MLLLRKHFGLSAEDAYARLPWWEVDVLVAAVAPRAGDSGDVEPAALPRTPRPDAFASVPDDLMNL